MHNLTFSRITTLLLFIGVVSFLSYEGVTYIRTGYTHFRHGSYYVPDIWGLAFDSGMWFLISCFYAKDFIYFSDRIGKFLGFVTVLMGVLLLIIMVLGIFYWQLWNAPS